MALVEQFEAGHTRGSSHGGSRIFRYAYADPVIVRLVVEARPLWTELEDDAGETLLDQIGALDHGDPPTVEALAAAMAPPACRSSGCRPTPRANAGPTCASRARSSTSRTAGRCLADATVAALLRQGGRSRRRRALRRRPGDGRAPSATACRVRAGDEQLEAPVGGGDGRRLGGRHHRAGEPARAASPARCG